MNQTSSVLQQTPFSYLLNVKMTLEVSGAKEEVFASEITDLSFNLHPYGFEGSCSFHSMKNDKLDDLFQKKGAIKIDFTFMPAGFDNVSEDPLIEFKGFVTTKSFQKIDSEEGREDEQIRIYQIGFCDAAKEIWTKHYPVNIYIDESMKTVFDAHKNADIQINYDFPELEKQHPILAFQLRYYPNKTINEQCSFYSFLHWYLQQENGIWRYDYKKHEYFIEPEKKQEEKPYSIYDRFVLAPKYLFPDMPRHNVRIHSHDADITNSTDDEQEEIHKQMLREVMDHESYLLFPEIADEEVKSIGSHHEYQVEVEACEFRNDFHLDKLLPGKLIAFKSNETMKGSWSHDPAYKDQTFRSAHVMFRATHSINPNKVKSEEFLFNIRVIALLEKKEESFVQRPYFNPPTFPFTIHGKVFSDIGDKEQSTYKLAESASFPKGHYLVDVPLIGEDKKLVVPFFPDFMTGQYYFPLCKGERVLLSIYFRTAKIQKTIDWQPLARLPLGIQGNQIVFSSNGKDKYVIMTHEFEDGKESVFTLKQSSSENQTQTIEIKEKEIITTVEEKNKKTVRTVYNSDTGLLLSLEDKEAKITQQTHFDGKMMTHTCKGDKTSTIVQKPDSIAITCDKFSVNSEKIVLSASDSISQTGKSKVNIESKTTNIASSTVNLGS